ncbi:MAG: hypothetical protein A07HN63_01577 [uncultured archaeon A07HN63]|nr:MAG: hypothetical protein A07HN63_01577 [uncultured archaeon A07HN63]
MTGTHRLKIRAKAVVSAAEPGTFDEGYSHGQDAAHHIQSFHAECGRDADRSEAVSNALADSVIAETATPMITAGSGC